MSGRVAVACRYLPLLAIVALVGLPRAEQEPSQEPAALQSSLRDAITLAADTAAQLPPAPDLTAQRPRRPGSLPALYGAFVGLQALDVHSTRSGIESGRAREANPLLKNVARNSAGLIAVKAASTAGLIIGTEKLWKKHRVAAVVVMAAVNAATAYVVVHNYRQLR